MNPFASDPRFAAKVANGQPDECWEWQGALSRGVGGGYGTYCLPRNGGPSKRIRAHRYGLELATGGPVPDDMDVDHLCRNRSCCNPSHLEVVTHKENMRRSPHQLKPGQDAPGAKVMRAKTECPQGHPYDEKNTGHRASGGRYCRACARDRMRRLTQQRKAVA